MSDSRLAPKTKGQLDKVQQSNRIEHEQLYEAMSPSEVEELSDDIINLYKSIVEVKDQIEEIIDDQEEFNREMRAVLDRLIHKRTRRSNGKKVPNVYSRVDDKTTALTVTNGDRTETFIIDADMEEKIKLRHWSLLFSGTTHVYAQSSHKKKHLVLHRLIADAPSGSRKVVIDHVNGNFLDCRKANLKVTTQSENLRKRRRNRVGASISGFKGVTLSKSKKRYVARLLVRGKLTHLGTFDDAVEAARVYDAAALALYGDYAVTTYPASDYMDADIQPWREWFGSMRQAA